ncbi:MAG: formate dehydrogenase subunit gamma [Alphaproteobacteria bacterium]|nr:formate dehydrogenase subunit gamma [Alphaproteobacteria bacterium]
MSRCKHRIGRGLSAFLVLVFAYAVAVTFTASPTLDNAAVAQSGGNVPGQSLGSSSDTEIWREIRKGKQGNVSIPDKKSGIMIQSQGESWRALRNGPLSMYGSWAIVGVIALLALFFTFRGRIPIEGGASGQTVQRFKALERFAHWMLANCFIVLALTGLNLLYGRYVLLPFIGPEAFSTITLWGKYVHNYIGFAFMLALLLILVLWIRENIPNKYDLTWIAKGGGMFTKGTHPPAKKFNAGQKILFWLVILGGISISASGIALMFPFEFSMFSGTFAVLNLVGFNLPTDLTPMQEMQYAQLWHAIVSLFLIVVVIGHIYIGTVGMEGAFDAMGSGEVDRNWAKEHHPMWLDGEEKASAPGDD